MTAHNDDIYVSFNSPSLAHWRLQSTCHSQADKNLPGGRAAECKSLQRKQDIPVVNVSEWIGMPAIVVAPVSGKFVYVGGYVRTNFNARPQCLTTCGGDGKIFHWHRDVNTGELSNQVVDHVFPDSNQRQQTHSVEDIIVPPDGKSLLTIGAREQWSVASGDMYTFYKLPFLVYWDLDNHTGALSNRRVLEVGDLSGVPKSYNKWYDQSPMNLFPRSPSLRTHSLTAFFSAGTKLYIATMENNRSPARILLVDRNTTTGQMTNPVYHEVPLASGGIGMNSGVKMSADGTKLFASVFPHLRIVNTDYEYMLFSFDVNPKTGALSNQALVTTTSTYSTIDALTDIYPGVSWGEYDETETLPWPAKRCAASLNSNWSHHVICPTDSIVQPYNPSTTLVGWGPSEICESTVEEKAPSPAEDASGNRDGSESGTPAPAVDVEPDGGDGGGGGGVEGNDSGSDDVNGDDGGSGDDGGNEDGGNEDGENEDGGNEDGGSEDGGSGSGEGVEGGGGDGNGGGDKNSNGGGNLALGIFAWLIVVCSLCAIFVIALLYVQERRRTKDDSEREMHRTELDSLELTSISSISVINPLENSENRLVQKVEETPPLLPPRQHHRSVRGKIKITGKKKKLFGQNKLDSREADD